MDNTSSEAKHKSFTKHKVPHTFLFNTVQYKTYTKVITTAAKLGIHPYICFMAEKLSYQENGDVSYWH